MVSLRNDRRMNLSTVIASHHDLRERIANSLQGIEIEDISLYEFLILKSFGFCFNGFKAIGLLLPDLYYEFAFILLRTVWEDSLNTHWVSKDPELRSKQFLQFTTVELMKALKFVNGNRDDNSIKIEKFLKSYIEDYEVTDKRGKGRVANNFAKMTVQRRASELGNEWIGEYNIIFKFGSSYVHASPGVLISPIITESSTMKQIVDSDRTLMISIWSMAIMTKLYRLFGAVFDKEDIDYIEQLESEFCLKDVFGV